MNATTTTKRVDQLTAGDVINMPATMNTYGFVGTVVSVGPWMLSAGPRAGQQATAGRGGKGAPLTNVDVAVAHLTDPPTTYRDEYASDSGRLLALTADWLVEVVV